MDIDNSSTAEPSDGGNTVTSFSPSPQQKKRQQSGKVHWIITINVTAWDSSNTRSLKEWLKIHSKANVWQIEKGESGNLHIQLTMSLREKKRLTWLKNHFSKIAHCEEVKALDKAFDYCQKSETRVAGPYYWPEQVNTTAIEDDLAGVELYEWQRKIIEIIKEKPHPRKIHWIVDQIGNKGKTSLVRHILLNYEAVLLDGNKKDMAYAWNGEPIVLFNFSRSKEGKVSYDALESLKDGVIFSSKYESKQKIFNRPHVVCFANWTPDIERMSLDRWEVLSLI